MQNVVGIDIGGSHITLSLVDAHNAEIVRENYIREYVDSFASKDIILSGWISAIQKLIKGFDKDRLLIGIAMPGPFDYNQGICLMKQGKFLDLLNINLKKELSDRLAVSEDQIFFLNDAAAFMEGEVYGGCAKGFEKVFGITLGTGLGTASFDGRFAKDEDLWNSSFRNSIAEDYLATRWFIERYEELTGERISGSRDLLDKPLKIRNKIFDEYAEALAEFVIKFVKPYDAEVLVLGGNIAKAYPLFREKFHYILESNSDDITVKISSIFEDAAILGAANFALKKNRMTE